MERGEDRPEDHRGSAARTCPRGYRRSLGRRRRRRAGRACRAEEPAREGDARGPTGVREKARLPNADEAARQNVLDKATQSRWDSGGERPNWFLAPPRRCPQSGFPFARCPTWSGCRRARLSQILDLFGEDSRLNVHAGELEVRPPGAPTSGPVRSCSAVRKTPRDRSLLMPSQLFARDASNL